MLVVPFICCSIERCHVVNSRLNNGTSRLALVLGSFEVAFGLVKCVKQVGIK